MYFNRMKEYYETQSSARYTIDGDVTEWVKVPFNEALYGRNYCGSIVCVTPRPRVGTRRAGHVGRQQAAPHRTARRPGHCSRTNDYLVTFDVEDRYDADGDGQSSTSPTT